MNHDLAASPAAHALKMLGALPSAQQVVALIAATTLLTPAELRNAHTTFTDHTLDVAGTRARQVPLSATARQLLGQVRPDGRDTFTLRHLAEEITATTNEVSLEDLHRTVLRDLAREAPDDVLTYIGLRRTGNTQHAARIIDELVIVAGYAIPA